MSATSAMEMAAAERASTLSSLPRGSHVPIPAASPSCAQLGPSPAPAVSALPAVSAIANDSTQSPAIPASTGAIAPRLDYTDHLAFRDVPYFGAPDPAIAALADAVNHLFAAAADPGFNPCGTQAQACIRAWHAASERLLALCSEPHSPQGKFVTELLRYARQLMLQDLVTPLARAVALPPPASAPVIALTERLYAHGFCFVTFPQRDVEALHAVVADDLARFRALASQGAVSRDQLSRNQWSPAQTAAMGEVFGKPDVLQALSRYMGRDVAYDGCAFELSVPGTQRWERYGDGADNLRTLYYHLDRTSHAPKAIFYLSQVDADHGPTRVSRLPYADQPFDSIIGRAMDSSALQRLVTAADGGVGGHLLASAAGRAVFAALPAQLRRLAHFGHDVPHDSAMEREVLAHESAMLGAPGTGVIFDGARLPHRGGIVTRSERLAFQVIYRCKGALNDAD